MVCRNCLVCWDRTNGARIQDGESNSDVAQWAQADAWRIVEINRNQHLADILTEWIREDWLLLLVLRGRHRCRFATRASLGVVEVSGHLVDLGSVWEDRHGKCLGR